MKDGAHRRSRSTHSALLRVERRVNLRRNGQDLRSKLLLGLVQVVAVVVRDQVHSQTQMSEATRSANAVQVRLAVLGEVEVDDDVHSLDIDSACEEVARYEVTALAAAEVLEHAVAVVLRHLGMNEKAAVSELRHLAREKLDAVRAVGKNDALVHLKLGEERVEARDLLPLVDVRVVLRDTLQSEVVHEVDDVRLPEKLVLELAHRDGECCRIAQNLPVVRKVCHEATERVGELWAEQLVRLVEAEHLALAELGHALVCEVKDAPGCRDDEVNRVVESHDIIFEAGSSGGDHHLQLEVLSEFLAHLCCLQRELARWHEHECLHILFGCVDRLDARDAERRGFSRSVLGTREDVSSCQRDGYGFLLDRAGSFETLFVDAHEKFSLEEVVLELVPLGCGDILRFVSRVYGRHVELCLEVASRCECPRSRSRGRRLLRLLRLLKLLLLGHLLRHGHDCGRCGSHVGDGL